MSSLPLILIRALFLSAIVRGILWQLEDFGFYSDSWLGNVLADPTVLWIVVGAFGLILTMSFELFRWDLKLKRLVWPSSFTILGEVNILWDGKGDILLRANFLQTGENLPIYLDFGYGGSSVTDEPTCYFYNKKGRVKIDEVESYHKGGQLNAILATVNTLADSQLQLQWGKLEYSNPSTGFSGSNAFCCIVLVQKDGHEERYPFLMVSRTYSHNNAPPIIICPQPLISFFNHYNA